MAYVSRLPESVKWGHINYVALRIMDFEQLVNIRFCKFFSKNISSLGNS